MLVGGKASVENVGSPSLSLGRTAPDTHVQGDQKVRERHAGQGHVHYSGGNITAACKDGNDVEMPSGWCHDACHDASAWLRGAGGHPWVSSSNSLQLDPEQRQR